MAKTKPNIQQKIYTSTLKLASSHEWSTLQLEQIARQAKISLAEIKKYYATTDDILPEIVDDFSQKVSLTVGKLSPNTPIKDRLFEIFMARFDLLQQNRSAILNILTYVKKNPARAATLLKAQQQAMTSMFKLTRHNPSTIQPLISASLLVVFVLTVATWQHDQSADMSKTMATLDRHLRYANKLAEIILRS